MYKSIQWQNYLIQQTTKWTQMYVINLSLQYCGWNVLSNIFSFICWCKMFYLWIMHRHTYKSLPYNITILKLRCKILTISSWLLPSFLDDHSVLSRSWTLWLLHFDIDACFWKTIHTLGITLTLMFLCVRQFRVQFPFKA